MGKTGLSFDDQTYIDLVELAYAAPLQPDGWPRFLTAFGRAIQGEIPGLVFPDEDFRLRETFVVPQIDEDTIEAHDYYMARNRFAVELQRQLDRPGRLVSGIGLISKSEYERSEYFNEWAKPLGVWMSINGCLNVNPTCLLGVYLPLDHDRFTTDQVELFRRLMPHLKRAARIHSRLRGAERSERFSVAALEGFGVAAISVDRDGTILWANRKAEALLRAEDGLATRARRLVGDNNRDSGALRLACAAACDGSAAGCALRLHRPSGKAALEVVISPMAGDAIEGSTSWGGVGLVLVSDPELETADRERLLAARLCALHGLTTSEARVAAAIAGGRTPRQIAEEVGTQANTVRMQLKAIYRKTGTQGQADLVRLVMSGVARWNPGR